ncbi:MAG: HNH endonuclease [Actinoplanes sp.]
MPTALWRDPSFAGMDWRAQRLYFLLSTQPDLNQAGYLPLLMKRWAGMSADGDVQGIRLALDELVSNEWAWVDEDFQEVLVRRHTAPAGHKQLQGALQATFDMSSRSLRQIAVAMLSSPDFLVGSPRTGSPLARMRILVYARDGFTCQGCGWAPRVPNGYDGRYALGEVKLDSDRGAYRVRLLELDHVFPESLGGLFEYDNLQTLCNSCNACKGARVA